jgi:CheY-like chemotaxis protein
MDGYEVAKRMRQQPALKSVVQVAMSGYGQESDRRRSQEEGFDHHLVVAANPGDRQGYVIPRMSGPLWRTYP